MRLDLLPFNFAIEWQAGHLHVTADALSRLFEPQAGQAGQEEHTDAQTSADIASMLSDTLARFTPLSDADFLQVQQDDQECKAIVAFHE